jgi:hypothetical protein
MKESTIVRRVDRFLMEDGMVTAREVPLGRKKIDLAAVDPHSRRVIAVEAKVRDWRAGLRQAMMYRLCANRVYLAVEERFSRNTDEDALARYGIGLIAVDGQATVVTKARESRIIHVGLLQEVRNHVEHRSKQTGGTGGGRS